MIRKKHFSLVELMIASALGLILMGMIMYTLNTTSRAVNNVTAQTALHNRARSILNKVLKDFECITPYNNKYYEYTNNDPSFEYTLLTTVNEKYDNSTPMSDYRWVKYTYNSSLKTLRRAELGPLDGDYADRDNPTPASLPSLSSTGDYAKIIDFNTTNFDVVEEPGTLQIDIKLKDDQLNIERSLGFAIEKPHK
jgi:type II secretory pathway pseudopilin PulG